MSVEIRSGATIDEAAAVEINQAIRSRWEGKLLFLNDVSAPHITTSSGRRYGTHPNIVNCTKKLALIVRSPVARMLGKVFIRTRRPPYPVRLFGAEDEAVAWLLAD